MPKTAGGIPIMAPRKSVIAIRERQQAAPRCGSVGESGSSMRSIDRPKAMGFVQVAESREERRSDELSSDRAPPGGDADIDDGESWTVGSRAGARSELCSAKSGALTSVCEWSGSMYLD